MENNWELAKEKVKKFQIREKELKNKLQQARECLIAEGETSHGLISTLSDLEEYLCTQWKSGVHITPTEGTGGYSGQGLRSSISIEDEPELRDCFVLIKPLSQNTSS